MVNSYSFYKEDLANSEKEIKRSPDEIRAIEVWGSFLKLLSDSVPENEVSTWFSVIKPKLYKEYKSNKKPDANVQIRLRRKP